MAATETEHVDAIVIGAGQGGGPLASALAEAGRKTALVESTHVGGTCVNEGCTPTKTMVASARVAYLARRAGDYGVRTGQISIDQARVRQRKRDIVDSFRSGSERSVTDTKGLDWLTGAATFTGPKRLTVRGAGDERTLSAELIFINTGARPAIPDLTGLAGVPYLTSTTIMELDSPPEHLIVLGAGPIALEFGQMFRRFGSAVTMLNRGPKLLRNEDDDVSQAMVHILEEDGITLLHGANATAVEASTGGVTVTVKQGDDTRTHAGSHLLLATGRTPNTDVLDPAAAGIAVDERGHIPVDDRLQTNVPGVYALGDVNGGPAFTHVSYDDYRIVRANLLDGGDRSTKDRLVPWCIYTDPELGRVGLSEREARERGRDIKVATMPMESVARALEMDEPRGVMKAVVDAGSGQLLGCAVLGIGGGELMTMMQLAIQGGLTAGDLADTVFAHPTLAESLNNLFGQVA